MTCTRKLLVGTMVALVLALPAMGGAGGGLTPGVVTGSDGVRAANGKVRYVALDGRGRTTVAAVRVADGRVLRWSSIEGGFGVPLVAYDGTTDGVSANGKTLVLGSFPAYGPGAKTRFAVLRLPSLRLQKTVELRGVWAFDAVSPDGRTIFATEYVSTDPQAAPRYRVRAIDVARGVPYAGAIVDKRNPGEAMAGQPVTRAFAAGRAWAYTLYVRPSGKAFVHALDTVHRGAACIDLPWRGAGNTAWDVRMTVSPDGETLTLAQRGTVLAEVDLRNFVVRPRAQPQAV